MEFSVSTLIIIGLVIVQLLIVAYLSYCCLMHPFQKKQEHRPRSTVN